MTHGQDADGTTAALKRLADRYPGADTPGAAVRRVALAVWTHREVGPSGTRGRRMTRQARTKGLDDLPVPTRRDILDALALVAAARAAIDAEELALLGEARRLDVVWEDIGAAYGRAPTTARQHANGRWRRLTRRLGDGT